MRLNFSHLFATLLLAATGLTPAAWAADQSIDDAFSRMERQTGKTPSAKGGGMDDPFSALEKSKGSSNPGAKGIVGGFESLDRPGKKEGATGHGIEAGFKDVEADRAAKEAERKRNELQAMQQNARKEDQEMQASCNPQVTPIFLTLTSSRTCSPNQLSRSAYVACERQNNACFEMSASECNAVQREKEREKEAEQAASRRAAEQKQNLCDAWKASGGKANSKDFLARLRYQEQSISNAQRAADEVARERDELIAADKKAVAAGTRLSGPAAEGAAREAAATKKRREDWLAAEAQRAQTQKERDDKLRAACVGHYYLCDCNRFDPNPPKVRHTCGR